MFLAEVGMIWEQMRESSQSKAWISAEPYKPHRRDKFLVLWELYQVICNEQCSLDTSDNYIIRYQSSPKVNYYSDFDFHLKSFNHFYKWCRTANKSQQIFWGSHGSNFFPFICNKKPEGLVIAMTFRWSSMDDTDPIQSSETDWHFQVSFARSSGAS